MADKKLSRLNAVAQVAQGRQPAGLPPMSDEAFRAQTGDPYAVAPSAPQAPMAKEPDGDEGVYSSEPEPGLVDHAAEAEKHQALADHHRSQAIPMPSKDSAQQFAAGMGMSQSQAAAAAKARQGY